MVYHYPHSEYFSDWEKPDFKTLNGQLVLWGAGKVGELAAHCLNKLGVNFLAFVDSAENRWATSYCEHRVISPKELKEDYPNAAILISNSFPAGTYSALEELGFNNVYDCSSLFMEIDFTGYNYSMSVEFAARNAVSYLRNLMLYKGKAQTLERIIFVINQKCSLYCKNCDGYTPYLLNPVNYDAGEIIQSAEVLFNAIGFIEYIDLMGGEPLLHKDLKVILNYFISSKNVNLVTLVTNGTIVPSSELLTLMQSSKFVCRISDYGVLSSKLGRLVEIFRKMNIKFEITNYQSWDSLTTLQKTNETAEELDNKFSNCTANVLYYQAGKVAYCRTVNALSNVGKEVLPKSDNNYLDLYDEHGSIIKNARERIVRFCDRLYARKHIDACQYCNGSHCLQFRDRVPVAEQADDHLSLDDLYIKEWIGEY
ncbi:MAG: hypothetical protein LBL26_02365 [Peptococcaceae bacterium]|jgi:organic radical activating enzyme|nr:hypothetical protein [Peptococcaceae bacterium]